MTFRKLIAALASIALLLTATGCEQSSVAGFNPDEFDTSELTDEEKQQLREFLVKTLEELDGTAPAAAEPSNGETSKTETNDGEAANAETTDEKATEGGTAKTEEPAVSHEPTVEEVIEEAKAREDADFLAKDESGHVNHTLAELIEHQRDVDEHALDAIIRAMDQFDKENTKEEKPGERLVELYYELMDAYEAEELLYCISELQYEVDTTNDAFAAKKTENQVKAEVLQNEAALAVKRALEGPYGNALKEVMSEREAERFLATDKMTERSQELTAEFSELGRQYDAVMHSAVEVEYNGEKYSSDNLNSLGLDSKDLTAIKSLVQIKQSELVWPIYQQVIRNRNEYAKEHGYDSYLSYAYSVTYDRDYTSEDIKALSSNIANYMTDLMAWSMLAKGDANLDKIKLLMEPKTIFQTIGENISAILPELAESNKYIVDNELFTCGSEAARADGAFMMPLPAMRAGLIFAKTSGTAQDYETLTHEFGHFNNAYHTYTPAAISKQHMDILEIHSQGLEMLGSTTLHNVFPDVSGDFTAGITLNMVQNITSALMVARFEIMCFENPDMTYEEANIEFGRCANLCMLGDAEAEPVPNGVWAIIHHLFGSPLYYVSYSISALSALDIYAQYLTDPEAALEKYTKLTHISPQIRYVEAMKEVGLRDMTKSANIQEVTSILSEHFQNEFVTTFQEGGKEMLELIGSVLSDLFTEVNN